MKNELFNIGLIVAITVGAFLCSWAYYRFRPRFHPHYRYFKDRHKEHEAGWRVLYDGECIAELDYLHDDQPFHLFRFTSLTGDQRKIDHALRSSARRDPDSRIEFQNRASGIRVSDGPLLANLNEPATVFIRDFRTPADSNHNARNAS